MDELMEAIQVKDRMERERRSQNSVFRRTATRWLHWLGLRYFSEDGSHRMAWGELSYGRRVSSCSMALFLGERGFSIHLQVPRLFNAFIYLPFLRRFSWDPAEMCENWGFTTCDGALHLNWGSHYKIFTFPWFDWKHLSHEVQRWDLSWAPYVGSYESKEPDGRYTEVHPYRYMLRNGTVQQVQATCHAERWTWRMRWFPWIRNVRHSIDIHFSSEVGERSGSWKGGCTACSYDLKPNETIKRCLMRMQEERRFWR